jgi:DNA polymerase-3 subunit gamma/tau
MQELLRSIVAEERNLLVAQLDPALLARDLSPEDEQAVRAAAAAAPQDVLVNGLRLLNEALAAARFSPNPRLDVETVVMRLVLSADAARSIGTAAQPTTAQPPSAQPAPAPQRAAKSKSPETAPPPPAAEAPTGEAPTLQRVRALWQNIRTRAEGERAPLRAPLSRATVDSIEDDVLTIRLVDAINESYVREHAPIIERAIAEVLGVPLRLHVKADRGSSQTRSSHRAAAREPEPAAEGDSDAIGLLDYASKTITPRTRS